MDASGIGGSRTSQNDTAAKVVVQRVDEGQLLIDNEEEWLQFGRGFVVYICFLKGATTSTVAKIVDALFACNHLEDPDSGKKASMAAKLKGNALQFHSLIMKEEGAALYASLVTQIQNTAEQMEKATKGKTITVVAGVYGNRQGLKFSSSGPNALNLTF
ncbi:unnamed protein product [Vitrella brassicaformis CCMP3155]|uniref:Uncharacterized protein n=1 Tax=Vitrella brassicaformis (strain CCMP3155) TaxID=1169540 RepID=A0A0G4ESG7_VITBC|nr:unnamed protein product [Vitrella brassicaformis CCMP3155]|eukprot:CEM00937.1 unnamed protein product [Vitrella brassicaformis CCMP3155]